MKKLLVSAILATLSSATLAAAPGFYVGGQLGWSKQNYGLGDFVAADKLGNHTPFTSGTVDTSGLGGRISAGYQFNQNWAAELGYTQYANVKYKNLKSSFGDTPDGSIKTNAIDVVGKGILPLDNGFSVFGKLGLAYVKTSFQDSFSVNPSENKWRPTYALGAGYDFNQNVTADVSWSRVQNGNNIKNLDLISAGVAYHFG